MVTKPKQVAETKAEVVEDEFDPWALESGLPNDVDAYMANCKFGTKDQYEQQIVAGGGSIGMSLMFMFDLVSEDGELLGNAGFSIGSGWQTEDDGETVVHATRKNVVMSTRYGALQSRCVKELGINMREYGIPTVAKTWEGLGFHWMLEEHQTLKKLEDGSYEMKQGLMPTTFIGVNEAIRGGEGVAEKPDKTSGPKISEDLEEQLTKIAQENDYKSFVKMAMKVEGVAKDDDLMSSVMDEGPNGFFAAHQS